MRYLFVILALTWPTGTSISAAENTPLEDSLPYKEVQDGSALRKLRIDRTRPADWKADDRRSAVIFFHGGGWTGGKPGQFASHSQELAKLGCVCFRVEYRLLDRKSNDPPEICVSDASDAIRFIRGRAKELGIDPNRIACGGGSAGGHLAAYLGMMDDEKVDEVSRRPNALLLFNPVYDNGPGGWGTKRVGDAFPKFSPAHNITADDPPSVVFLGDSDDLIPVSTAEKFKQTCKSVGVRSDLYTYKGQPHGFFNVSRSNGKYYRDTLAKSIEFLKSLSWF
ncbi:MAG: alpha/beta hydrolase [Planctomycetota bacterium]